MGRTRRFLLQESDAHEGLTQEFFLKRLPRSVFDSTACNQCFSLRTWQGFCHNTILLSRSHLFRAIADKLPNQQELIAQRSPFAIAFAAATRPIMWTYCGITKFLTPLKNFSCALDPTVAINGGWHRRIASASVQMQRTYSHEIM